MRVSFERVKSLEQLDMLGWGVGWKCLLGDSVSPMQVDEFRHLLEIGEFLWEFPGEPSAERPHALLTSGKHSNLFINVGDPLKRHVGFRALCAHALWLSIREFLPSEVRYCVIGTATSATDLAATLAWFMNTSGFPARSVPLEKYDLGDGTSGQWWIEGEHLEDDEAVVRVEELITTADSARKANEAILQAYPYAEFFPRMPVLVDRASEPITSVDGLTTVVTAYRFEGAGTWAADECPYCRAGSEAIRPREGDNWARLTGRA